MSTPKKTRHINQPLGPKDVNGVSHPPNRGHGSRASGAPLKIGGFADLWRGQPAQPARSAKPVSPKQPVAPNAGPSEPPRLPLADAIVGLQAAVQMNNSLLMDNNRLLADIKERLDINARLISGLELSSSDMALIASSSGGDDIIEQEEGSSHGSAEDLGQGYDGKPHSDAEELGIEPTPSSEVMGHAMQADEVNPLSREELLRRMRSQAMQADEVNALSPSAQMDESPSS